MAHPAMARPPGGTEFATLGGGCFWCLEAVFLGLRGVKQVVPGYAGGTKADPTYEEVCTGTTGHAEVVQITFDPGEISFRELLEVFFTIHDPTTVDRQGQDVGSQYRSVVFCHDPGQAASARQVIADLARAGVRADPIVTQVVALGVFYEAEEHHRNYFARNSRQAYCQVVIAPKLARFRKRFLDRLKP